MRHKLPSLTALRAFEAAARHESHTVAAEELGVTQAAVSHQVKVLEEGLGVVLFSRQSRRLRLTEEGRALSDVVSSAFDRIAEGVEELCATQRRQRILTVGVPPTFGQFWLPQRLARFWRRTRNIELRIHHSVGHIDMERSADIAIRLGHGRWKGVESEFLMRSEFAPFCSPGLLGGTVPLQTPEDLRRHTLLHAYGYELWSEWLKAAGIDDIDFERGPVIDDPFVLEFAAIEGRGVALCPMSLLGDYLADGRLVRPFAFNPETNFAFHIVYQPGALKKRKVRAFRDFLLEEVAADARSATVLRCAHAAESADPRPSQVGRCLREPRPVAD